MRKRGEPLTSSQIVQARTYRRTTPLWTKSDKKIQQLLLRSFPKMKVDAGQRASAARWASVIHFYFRMAYTRAQIAHELGSTTTKIHGIIRSILRVSNNLAANGSGVLGRPRGKPKKRAPQSSQ